MGVLEVEVSELRVAASQYVYGEDVFPFAEANREKLRRQITVVSLTPGQRVSRIIGRVSLVKHIGGVPAPAGEGEAVIRSGNQPLKKRPYTKEERLTHTA